LDADPLVSVGTFVGTPSFLALHRTR